MGMFHNPEMLIATRTCSVRREEGRKGRRKEGEGSV